MGNSTTKSGTPFSFISDIIKPFDLFVFKKNSEYLYGIFITSDLISLPNKKDYYFITAIKKENLKYEFILHNLTDKINEYSNNISTIQYYKLINNPFDKNNKESEFEWNNRTNKLKELFVDFYIENTCSDINYSCSKCFKTTNIIYSDIFLTDIYKLICFINCDNIFNSKFFEKPVEIFKS